ncbi:unnamed protein product [Trichobilharzia szidati]|nr:unnamed protein product [Trichobilharzia szidati]
MVKVCVVGCLHGELDCVYANIAEAERQGQFKTDLVLCCGDFQSVRNPADLDTMSIPPKYYRMGDFWRYYAEETRAPILTLFVGGNHEASAYLQELPYGGWVAPNIWYMGYAGVVQFAGLRIAGLSGIYKQHDYTMSHYERPPYSEATKRSVYHLRNLEIFRLGQIRRRLDIVFSHDWPRGIYHYGNTNQLTRRKPHFRSEIDSDILGSPPGEQLLCRLKPRYWFSAHLHCKFSALVEHSDSKPEKPRTTRFLALDKCLPNRHYLQFLDIEPELSQEESLVNSNSNSNLSSFSSQPGEDDPIIVSLPNYKPNFKEAQTDSNLDESANDNSSTDEVSTNLYLDPEWLSILRSTNYLMSTSKVPCILPDKETSERFDFSATDEEIQALYHPFGGDFQVPDNFERTAASYKPNEIIGHVSSSITSTPMSLVQQANLFSKQQQKMFSNPQTELLCAMLDLINPNAFYLGKESYSLLELSAQLLSRKDDDDDDDEDEEEEEEKEEDNGEAEDEAEEEGEEEEEHEAVDENVINAGVMPDESYLNTQEYSPHVETTAWVSTDSVLEDSGTEYDPMNSVLVSNIVLPEYTPVIKTNLYDSIVSQNPEEVPLDDIDDDDDDDDDDGSLSETHLSSKVVEYDPEGSKFSELDKSEEIYVPQLLPDS